jgi:hypothetical protein
MSDSPAGRAIGIAAFVVSASLAVYATAAVLDRWGELVIAAWGAALGAGMAINGIIWRELDFDGASTTDLGVERMAGVQHQVCSLLTAIGAWQTAETEAWGWAAATVIIGVGWALTFSRLVAGIEHASVRNGMRIYGFAFQLVTIVAALGLIYASIALETPWLWRPTVPADLQAFVWLTVLEFAGLPLTLLACARTRRARLPLPP